MFSGGDAGLVTDPRVFGLLEGILDDNTEYIASLVDERRAAEAGILPKAHLDELDVSF